MGLTNWMVQRSLKKTANKLADWAVKTYPATKAQFPRDPESEIIRKMMFPDLSKAPANTTQKIRTCCQSIEGLCYVIAMDMGPLEGWAELRCLQFTLHMDSALYARGFPRQSKKTKESILTALGLLFKDWEKWMGNQ